MGKRGPAPKPTALKMMQGTYKPSRAAPNEPRPEKGIPPCPDWLQGKAREYWADVACILNDMGVLTIADGKALEMVCYAYAEWRQLVDDIRECGRTYETTTTAGDIVRRPRPEVSMEADMFKRVWDALAKFGMTPSDRSRVSAIAPEKADPFAELAARRAQQRAG